MERGSAQPETGLRRPDWLRAREASEGGEFARAGLTQLSAFALAILLLIGFLAAIGYSASGIIAALWDGSVGSSLAIERSLIEAMPIVLTATAVWLAYAGGLYNIGADGQLQIGGLAALFFVLSLPDFTPGFGLILVGVVTGAIGGALWALIAVAIRIFRGASEIISTLMLNFVAFGLITRLIDGPLRAEGADFSPRTERIPSDAILPVLAGGLIPLGILVAVVASLGVILFIQRSNVGLRLRAVGRNRDAASHAGVRIDRYWLTSFAVSGALAGLAGAIVILGLRFFIGPGWAPAWGFLGIVVAFMALRTPLLIPVWGILLGMLGAAGPVLKGDASVPDAIVTVMQTLPVVMLFLLLALQRYWASKVGAYR